MMSRPGAVEEDEPRRTTGSIGLARPGHRPRATAAAARREPVITPKREVRVAAQQSTIPPPTAPRASARDSVDKSPFERSHDRAGFGSAPADPDRA